MELFERILIPEAVREELQSARGTPAAPPTCDFSHIYETGDKGHTEGFEP